MQENTKNIPVEKTEREFTCDEIVGIGRFISSVLALKQSPLNRLKIRTWYKPFQGHFDNIMKAHNELVADLGGDDIKPIEKYKEQEYFKQWKEILAPKMKISFDVFDLKWIENFETEDEGILYKTDILKL